MIRDIIVGITRSLLQTAFGGAAGWLVARGTVTNGQLELLFAVMAGVVVNLIWTVADRLIKRWHLETALQLRAGADLSTLQAISDATPLGVKLAEAVAGKGAEKPLDGE